MADYQAINIICRAVMALLEANVPEDFPKLTFEVFRAKEYTDKPMTEGVSLLLYRIYVNGSNRNKCGRLSEDGRQYGPQLSLDLHFLLTVWGQTADMQNAIAGWMMRTMLDNSSIKPLFLNSFSPEVFHNDEEVEVIPADLSTEDMLRLWELIGHDGYQLSVPYIARDISIESHQLQTEGQRVQKRKLILNSI